MNEIEKDIRQTAHDTISQELASVQNLLNFIDDDFVKSVLAIYNCKGRVIVSGIGKSAIIATKIVATMNSTGTPSIFMHAADAIHGDLGIIQKDDVVICISKSGNTPEINVLVPLIKMRGNTLIAMVGNRDSYLAKQADFIVDCTVSKEACPNNLAPTSSSTAQLVMGDSLAVCLLKLKGFTAKDFAKFHPGGALGKQLYLRVSDLYVNNSRPFVKATDGINKIIYEISSGMLGMAAVLNEKDEIVGIITDGDIRRMLEKNPDASHIKAEDIMSRNPKTIHEDMLAVDALQLMREKKITSLLIINSQNEYIGVVHIHNILREGII